MRKLPEDVTLCVPACDVTLCVLACDVTLCVLACDVTLCVLACDVTLCVPACKACGMQGGVAIKFELQLQYVCLCTHTEGRQRCLLTCTHANEAFFSYRHTRLFACVSWCAGGCGNGGHPPHACPELRRQRHPHAHKAASKGVIRVPVHVRTRSCTLGTQGTSSTSSSRYKHTSRYKQHLKSKATSERHRMCVWQSCKPSKSKLCPQGAKKLQARAPPTAAHAQLQADAHTPLVVPHTVSLPCAPRRRWHDHILAIALGSALGFTTSIHMQHHAAIV